MISCSVAKVHECVESTIQTSAGGVYWVCMDVTFFAATPNESCSRSSPVSNQHANDHAIASIPMSVDRITSSSVLLTLKSELCIYRPYRTIGGVYHALSIGKELLHEGRVID